MRQMGESRHETEIKLPFDSPERAAACLQRCGAARRGEREFEDNLVFDTAARSLSRSGRLLRLRQFEGRWRLTFKAPVAGEFRHKVREERELEVADADALRAILEGLGLHPVYRYQKYRTRYRHGQLDVSLDETPVGCFVELEGPAPAIDRLASRMGFAPERYVLATYRELQERAAGPGAAEPGDMLMPDGEPSSAR